jgi:hypothetical protein
MSTEAVDVTLIPSSHHYEEIVHKICFSPEDRMLLRYSRKPSSLMSKSVNIKVVPFP